jgi:hypothetical protein
MRVTAQEYQRPADVEDVFVFAICELETVEGRYAFMITRMICAAVLGMAVAMGAQTVPVLQTPLSRGDTKISGTAQGKTSDYSTIQIYLCTSTDAPAQGTGCSELNAENTTKVKILPLVNLMAEPFAVTAPDGKFTVTLVNPLVVGTYIWVTQVTIRNSTTEKVVKTSQAIQVRTLLIESASLSVSGTDSASRDIGEKATLNVVRGQVDNAIGQTRLFLTANYDDKWKSAPLSSNISELFSGQLMQLRQFHPAAYLGPFAMAYRNNTQGVRVEQTYGFGMEKDFYLGGGNGVTLGVWPEAMIENLFPPGRSVNLFGAKLSAQLSQSIGKGSVVTALTYTPSLNQTHDWNATGLWSLNLPFNQHWSFNIQVQDNYYEIAPKTFNKNYLLPSIGVAFK